MSYIPTPTIIRASRKTIALHITPSGEVIVKAPRFVPTFIIHQFIHSKKDWIIEKTRRVEERKVKPKEYKEGELFFYLGKQYPLHLGNYQEISVTDTFNYPRFLLFCIKKELERWYKRQARDILTQRVAYHAGKMGAEYKSIRFSDTKSKWGTCGPENDLQFNWRLVMVPLVVADYVVIHELVHTTEKNHSINFWKQVRKFTPAYKQHRKWLNNHAHLLTF